MNDREKQDPPSCSRGNFPLLPSELPCCQVCGSNITYLTAPDNDHPTSKCGRSIGTFLSCRSISRSQSPPHRRCTPNTTATPRTIPPRRTNFSLSSQSIDPLGEQGATSIACEGV